MNPIISAIIVIFVAAAFSVGISITLIMVKERMFELGGVLVVALSGISMCLGAFLLFSLNNQNDRSTELQAACPNYTCTYDELKLAAFDLGINKDSDLFKEYELAVLKRAAAE